MESCWAGQPSQRPLLGLVEPVLQSIKLRYEQGKSVMPDRYARKKRPTRQPSWPNPSDELKLENLPLSDKPTLPMEVVVGTKAIIPEDFDTVTIKEKPPPSPQILDFVTTGLATGVTDIDRTVCVNRDLLTVTNVYVEPSQDCYDGNGFEGAHSSSNPPKDVTGAGHTEDRTQEQFQIPMPFLMNR